MIMFEIMFVGQYLKTLRMSSIEIILHMGVNSLVYPKHFNKHLISINNVQRKHSPLAQEKVNELKRQKRNRHTVT